MIGGKVRGGPLSPGPSCSLASSPGVSRLLCSAHVLVGWPQSSITFPSSSGLALPNQVHFYPPTPQPLNPFLAPDCLLSGVGRLGRIPGTQALQSFCWVLPFLPRCILSSKHRDRGSPLVGPDGLQSVTRFWSRGLSWPLVTAKSQ